MRRIILGIALASQLAGCASTHKGRAIQLVVVSDAAADEIASGWDTFVDQKIAGCRESLGEESTPEAREECLGIAGQGEPLEAAVQSLVVVQTVIKEAVKCEEFKSCVKEADWKNLKAEIYNAWRELEPYFQAIKGGN